jgi:hypothetical protein
MLLRLPVTTDSDPCTGADARGGRQAAPFGSARPGGEALPGLRFTYAGSESKATTNAGATELDLPADIPPGQAVRLFLVPGKHNDDWFLVNPQINVPLTTSPADVVLMRRSAFRQIAAAARDAVPATDTPSARLIQRDYTSYYDYYTHADAGPPKPGTNAPAYATDLGRKVFGGGGITPDVEVKEEQLSPFEQFLLAHNAFVNFGVEYKSHHPIPSQDWKPTSAVLDEFRTFLQKEKVATAEEIDQAYAKQSVKDFILTQVRAEAINTAYGQEARSRVIAGNDKQVQSAVGLFDRAARMLAQRRELKEDKRAAK